MYRLPRLLAFALIALLVRSAVATAADAGQGVIRGAITDTSDGALPGVTVTVTAADGRVVATAVTDGTGAYLLESLPTEALRLTFQLDGFATASEAIAVQPDVVSVVGRRLELAAVTETVVVVGKAPDFTPPPVRRPPPLPPVAPVAAHDRDSICGPAKPAATPESFGTIRSRREAARELYAKDDELMIEGGTLDGIAVGQNLVVRRQFRALDGTGGAVVGEHTAGVLQIVAAHDHDSTAVVVYACDELRKGDSLASFKPEPLRDADPVGFPAYNAAARILFADAGQMLGAPRRLMVIDRGSDQGLHVGQRVTLFRRRTRGGAKPTIVGDAVVVAIRGDSATIRVEGATDVIASGDWAAPQYPSSAAASIATSVGAKHP